MNWNAGGIKLKGTDQSQGKQYRIIGGDYDYLRAYGARLIAGRVFSKEFTTDPHAVVFKMEKATEGMGFDRPEQAVGKQISTFGGMCTPLLGVVDNYHQQSLHDAYDALIFPLYPRMSGAMPGNKYDKAVYRKPFHRYIKSKLEAFFPQG